MLPYVSLNMVEHLSEFSFQSLMISILVSRLRSANSGRKLEFVSMAPDAGNSTYFKGVANIAMNLCCINLLTICVL